MANHDAREGNNHANPRAYPVAPRHTTSMSNIYTARWHEGIQPHASYWHVGNRPHAINRHASCWCTLRTSREVCDRYPVSPHWGWCEKCPKGPTMLA